MSETNAACTEVQRSRAVVRDRFHLHPRAAGSPQIDIELLACGVSAVLLLRTMPPSMFCTLAASLCLPHARMCGRQGAFASAVPLRSPDCGGTVASASDGALERRAWRVCRACTTSQPVVASPSPPCSISARGSIGARAWSNGSSFST